MKKYTKEIASELKSFLALKEVSTILESITEEKKKEYGFATFVISTNNEDRHGEIVDQKGLDLSYYKTNPIVIADHDYRVEKIIGKVVAFRELDDSTEVDVVFAKTELGQYVRGLVDDDILKAVSIGFIPKGYSAEDPRIIISSEMIELSVVVVGSNRQALKKMATSAKHKAVELGLFKSVDEIEEEAEEELPHECECEDLENCTCNTPSEEATEEPEKEVRTMIAGSKKGEIADQFNKETKWSKLEVFDKLFFAFYQVWFDWDTNFDDWEELVTEYAELVQIAASGNEIPKEKMIEIEAKAFAFKATLAKKDAEEKADGEEKTAYQEALENGEAPDTATEEEAVEKAIKIMQGLSKSISSGLHEAKKLR